MAKGQMAEFMCEIKEPERSEWPRILDDNGGSVAHAPTCGSEGACAQNRNNRNAGCPRPFRKGRQSQTFRTLKSGSPKLLSISGNASISAKVRAIGNPLRYAIR